LRTYLLALVLPSALALGCSSTSSSQLTTDQIKARFRVTENATDGKGYAGASFERAGSITAVKLEGQDKVVFLTDQEPERGMDWMVSGYIQDLPRRDRNLVTFRFQREGQLIESKVTPMRRVDTTVPATVSRAGGLKLQWSNPVPKARIVVTSFGCAGASASSLVVETEDTGSLVMPPEKLTVNAPPAAGECVSLRIARRLQGEVGAGFAAGSEIYTEYEQTEKLTVLP
jgi:hypothetical protein